MASYISEARTKPLKTIGQNNCLSKEISKYYINNLSILIASETNAILVFDYKNIYSKIESNEKFHNLKNECGKFCRL